MEILRGLWSIARGIALVGKGLVGVAKWVLSWAVANPLGAVIVGVTLIVASWWLKAQPWAGADVLANVVGLAGQGILGVGIGSWIGRQIGLLLKETAVAVGKFLKEAVQSTPGGPWWYVFPSFTGPAAIAPVF